MTITSAHEQPLPNAALSALIINESVLFLQCQPGSLISLAIGLRTHFGEAEVLTNAARLLLNKLLESSLTPRIRDEW